MVFVWTVFFSFLSFYGNYNFGGQQMGNEFSHWIPPIGGYPEKTSHFPPFCTEFSHRFLTFSNLEKTLYYE